MIKSKWKILLKGDDKVLLDIISKSLVSAEDILKISKENEQYYLISEWLNNKTDFDDLHQEAKRLLTFLNGIIRCFLGLIEPPLKLEKIIEVGEKKNIVTEYFGGKISIINSNDLPPNMIRELYQSAIISNDKKIEEVFHLFGEPDFNWFNAYKIHEVIKNDAKGEIKRWTSPGEEKRFTQTANNTNDIGEKKRHRVGKDEPNKNPMSLNVFKRCSSIYKKNHLGMVKMEKLQSYIANPCIITILTHFQIYSYNSQ